MNKVDSILPRKSIVVAVILLAALTWMTGQLRNIAETRRSLSEQTRDKLALEQDLTNASNSLASLRGDFVRSQSNLQAQLQAIAGAEQKIAAVDPESRWAIPPTCPSWDESSPYIWLPKSFLPQLPVQPFSESGELNPEVASTMTFDTGRLRELNQKLRIIIGEYRSYEAAHAERIEEPLAGISTERPHATFQITPFPKEGARLREQFEHTLRTGLGDQRSELLLATGANWLDSQFALTGSDPKTISLVPHSDGTYNISVKTGNSWFSTGGFRDPAQYIPEHLLALFTDALTELSAPDFSHEEN